MADVNNVPLRGVNPENNYVPGAPLINTPQRPRPIQNPLINIRDRLFHALFFRTALAYAKAIPV